MKCRESSIEELGKRLQVELTSGDDASIHSVLTSNVDDSCPTPPIRPLSDSLRSLQPGLDDTELFDTAMGLLGSPVTINIAKGASFSPSASSSWSPRQIWNFWR